MELTITTNPCEPFSAFQPLLLKLENLILAFQDQASSKLTSLTISLNHLQIQISDYKFSLPTLLNKGEQNDLRLCQKYLKKIISDKEQLQDFYDELKSEKKNLEIRFLKNTINLENQLKVKTAEISSQKEQINKLEGKIEALQQVMERNRGNLMSDRLEQMIITNVTLQGEISALESQNVKMKTQIDGDGSRMKSFSSELESSKNFRLSDVSDNQTSGKEKEIQELREALQSISNRYERDKEILLKDLEESRQDMEVQIFRLRQEKAYQESICKDLQKHLQELSQEKSLQEKELFHLRQLIDRQNKSPRPSKHDTEIVSFDFDISKSIEVPDGSNTLPTKTIQDAILEELNEISVDLRKKHKIDLNTVTIFELVKSTLAHMIKIQEAIESETSNSSNYKEITRNLSDVISKLKLRVRNIEEESIILNKKVDQSEFERVFVDGKGCSGDKEHLGLLQYYKGQLQIEKAKVLEKKHVIKLHKEQIGFLKQSLREVQFEKGKVKIVDFEYIKEVFKSLIRDVPVLSERLEGIVDLIVRLLGVSENEKKVIDEQRADLKTRLV